MSFFGGLHGDADKFTTRRSELVGTRRTSAELFFSRRVLRVVPQKDRERLKRMEMFHGAAATEM